jgi:quercetin dioxygenase-like cupin family protein
MRHSTPWKLWVMTSSGNSSRPLRRLLRKSKAAGRSVSGGGARVGIQRSRHRASGVTQGQAHGAHRAGTAGARRREGLYVCPIGAGGVARPGFWCVYETAVQRFGRDARATMLLRLAPGGKLVAHRHRQVEEFYVLEGSCICAGEFLQAGDYHRAEAGSVHPITSSDEGCLALVMTSTQNEPAG